MINSLKHFVRAMAIQEKMADKDIFVRVVKGKNVGTVGRIVMIQRHHFERHTYHLEVEGKMRSFCGSLLEETDITQTTMCANTQYVREFRDTNDRLIELGQCVNFMRACRNKSGYEMVLGSVHEINMLGVHITPFAVNGVYGVGYPSHRAVKTDTMLMIIDGDTQGAILVNKLAAPDLLEKAA